MSNTKPRNILTPAAGNVKPVFADMLRAYEADPRNVDALYPLAKVVALSVIKKLSDPQRSTAPTRDTVSKSGCNPRMVALRLEIMADYAAMDNIMDAAASWVSYYDWTDGKPRPRLNDNGDPAPVVDPAALDRLNALMTDALGDGLDLVHWAAQALLEAYDDAAARGDTAPGWMERAYTVSVPRKYVLLPGDDVEMVDKATTPVQAVYRYLRDRVQAQGGLSVAVNGYTYSQIDTADIDSVDAVDVTIYRRYGKYADIGGYVHGDGTRLPGGPSGMGNAMAGLYTAGADESDTVKTAAALMGLSVRQADILSRLYDGQPVGSIAAALRVTPRYINKIINQIQTAAAAVGIAPSGWTPSDRPAPAAARPVRQSTIDGQTVAVYQSCNAAAAQTGINVGSIAAAAAGKRQTAGGYVWQYV